MNIQPALQMTAIESTAETYPEHLPRLRALVATDNATRGEGLLRTFGELGIPVILAGSAESATDALSIVPFDVAIVDVNLPDLPAMQRRFRTIKQLRPASALILNGSTVNGFSPWRAGFSAMYAEPLPRESVREIIRRHVLAPQLSADSLLSPGAR